MASEKTDKIEAAIVTSSEETDNGPRKITFLYLVSILVLGQFLSFCITATSVATTYLNQDYAANIPTTQTWLNYILLAIIYTAITIHQQGIMGWLQMMKKRGWMYLILSIMDVEGNYFVNKAYMYTSILSAMLLDAWSIPVVVCLSLLILKSRYHWSQYIGILTAIGGLGLLVKSDIMAGRDMQSGLDLIKGDIFCIIGATFYAFSNVGEEYFVRKYPLTEVVGQMGFWGTIVTGVQLAILERDELSQTQWTGGMVGYLLAYNAAMFALYTGTPFLFRLSSATFFNLSLLTSDFYGLIFGLLLFQYQMTVLYPFAYVFVIIGCIIFYIYPAKASRDARRSSDTLREPEKQPIEDGHEIRESEKRIVIETPGTNEIRSQEGGNEVRDVNKIV